jgi:tyrosyl-tRNA synthetase
MFAVSTEDPAIQAQLREISVGAQEVFPLPDMARKLALKRPLRVKLGFDPTKPDLHLGHAVVLNGLRRFQQAGHQIVVIIGDFTARIGDPTGKESARPPLSADDVEVNAKTYLEQLGILIDLSKAEIRHNSEWLAKLSLEEVIRLLGKATVAQMLARENFANRYERGDAIGLHELLYPLMQGYDSVAIGADIELGGTDQRFNLLVGRDLQGAYGQDPQVCVTYPILEGTDGKEKMSKSLDNYVGLTMTSADMFGRTMSIPDELIASWYRLASGLPEAEIREILEAPDYHPRNAKMRLGRAIAALYHGPEAGKAAEDAFVRQFKEKGLPPEEQIRKTVVSSTQLQSDLPNHLDPLNIVNLGVASASAATTSQARSLIKGGAVRIITADGEEIQVTDPKRRIDPSEIPPEGLVIRFGKLAYTRILLESSDKE